MPISTDKHVGLYLWVSKWLLGFSKKQIKNFIQ